MATSSSSHIVDIAIISIVPEEYHAVRRQLPDASEIRARSTA